MDYGQTFRTAVRNLCANKVRFLHSMLGMVIGIAGFILALSCGNLSLTFIGMEGDEFASELLDTWVETELNYPVRITAGDMAQVAAENPDVIRAISPYLPFNVSGGVRYGEQLYDEAAVIGVDSSYQEMIPVLHLQEGRFLEDIDIARERKVCVVEHDIANKLMGGDALGQTLKIWGENYTVVGVFAEVPNSLTRNIEVFIPYTNARKMIGDTVSKYSNYYEDRYYVLANGAENMYDAQVLIKEMMQKRTGREDGKSVWYLGVYAFSGTTEMIRSFVYGQIIEYVIFALIVLLVGGVGIMNVMLASVQARTKEIGIRKAFGATNRDIKRQFSLEAVITSLIGCAFGIVIGFAGTYLLCRVADISLIFLKSLILPVLAAVSISVLVGAVFGTYPAAQAAKMEPVTAINQS